TVDFDDVGGDEHGENLSVATSHAALAFMEESRLPQFLPEGLAVLRIGPQGQFLRIAPQDLIESIARPLEKRLIRQDVTAIVHPRNRDENRAAFERRAESRLALAQARLALTQLLLRPLSLGDVHAHRKHVRGVIDFDGFGGKQDRRPLPAAISPAALSLAQRTEGPHLLQYGVPL